MAWSLSFLGVLMMWMFWACVYMAQMYPLYKPIIAMGEHDHRESHVDPRDFEQVGVYNKPTKHWDQWAKTNLTVIKLLKQFNHGIKLIISFSNMLMSCSSIIICMIRISRSFLLSSGPNFVRCARFSIKAFYFSSYYNFWSICLLFTNLANLFSLFASIFCWQGYLLLMLAR